MKYPSPREILSAFYYLGKWLIFCSFRKLFLVSTLTSPWCYLLLFSSLASDLEKLVHTLDVCVWSNCLAVYTLRTKQLWKSNELFIRYWGPKKSEPVTPQCWCKWVVNVVVLPHQLAKGHWLCPWKAIQLEQLLHLWLSSKEFKQQISAEQQHGHSHWHSLKHFTLDARAKLDASFGRAVRICEHGKGWTCRPLVEFLLH